MKPLVAIAAVFAAGLMTFAGAAVAGPDSLGSDWRQQQDEAREAVRNGHLMPLSQVVAMLHRRTPGRQLDAGLEYQGSRAVYRVRWITNDGRRIDYLVDATNGAILSGG